MGVFDKIKRGLEEAIDYERSFAGTPADNLAAIDSMGGREFEQWCAGLLHRLGYSIKIAPTPHADIVAERNGITYAVECKCGSARLGNSAIKQAYFGKGACGCHIGVVMANFNFLPKDEAIAEDIHIQLWGRDTLLKMLEAIPQNN